MKKIFSEDLTRADCPSVLEMICSESHAFRDEKGRIVQYFQGLTQRAARTKSRMRQALATEELRGAKKSIDLLSILLYREDPEGDHEIYQDFVIIVLL